MDPQDQTKAQDNLAAPSGTTEDQGNGETPAGGTANPPVKTVKASTAAVASEPTIAEHVETHAAAIDAQIAALTDKKDAVTATPEQGLPASTIALRKNQTSAIDAEIAILSEKKTSILAFLENIPAELHDIDARIFAAIKHLF